MINRGKQRQKYETGLSSEASGKGGPVEGKGMQSSGNRSQQATGECQGVYMGGVSARKKAQQRQG